MNRTILIVDDVTTNRKLLKALLKDMENINFLEAEDGNDALRVIAQNPVSVIILDIMMPFKDGIQVLKELKESHEYRNIPVIICSAAHESESVEKALQLGALDYFSKPLSEEDMRITLPLKIRNALEYFESKNQLMKFYEHMKDEMMIARQLQKSLISEHLTFNGVEMWGKYLPCQEIGGDIYCCKQTENKTWFMMADVCGHGISAAMISTMLNVLFSININHSNDPADVLRNINKTICEVFNGLDNGVASMFAGYIEGNMITYANAGHPYPLLYRNSDESIEEIQENGFLLGVLNTMEYKSEVKRFDEGDLIILYTDGLFDKGVNNGFAKWSLVKEYCSLKSLEFKLHINVILDELVEHFAKLDDCDFLDDVAVLILKNFGDNNYLKL